MVESFLRIGVSPVRRARPQLCSPKHILVFRLCALLCLIGTSAVTQGVDASPGARAGPDARALQFAKIRFSKASNGVRVVARAGWGCDRTARLDDSVRRVLNRAGDLFAERFDRELRGFGYEVRGPEAERIFKQTDGPPPALLIGAVVRKADIDFCYAGGVGGGAPVSGSASMEVHWEIFDVAAKRVVSTPVTRGSARVDKARPNAEFDLMTDAFAEATRTLLTHAQARAVLHGGAVPGEQVTLKPMRIPSAAPFRGQLARNMERVLNAVVIIELENGHGSGFLISTHGHVLTNAHVVRGAQQVSVRLHSGLRVSGRVVRKNVAADVALIDLGANGLDALPFDSAAPKIGQEVYAVGAPLSTELSASVSRGIVSGLRNVLGHRLLQSDVNVLPGNSGGPLLDRHGNVVAMTSFGLLADGQVGLGVNFFIPVRQALQAVGINTSAPVRGDRVVASAAPVKRPTPGAADEVQPPVQKARIALLEPTFILGYAWGANAAPIHALEARFRDVAKDNANVSLVFDYDQLRVEGKNGSVGKIWDDNFVERRPLKDSVLSAGRRLGVDHVLMFALYLETYNDDAHRVVAFWLDVGSGEMRNFEGMTDEPRTLLQQVAGQFPRGG